MIDRTHRLSITRQAEALGISRGAVYYVPRAASARDLVLMRRMDAVHLEMPLFGARGLRRVLKAEFPGGGRPRYATLMPRWGSAPSRRSRARASGTARIPSIRIDGPPEVPSNLS